MAIPCLHEEITREVLGTEFHFVQRACDIAARANAAVDERQGSGAEETKLHAMRGYITNQRQPGYERLQTEEEASGEVDRLLAEAKQAILGAITAGSYEEAMRLLGQAHHTLQDRAFHNFEPWPYAGIVDAVLRSPNYMVCHAVRDLGVVSRLDLRADGSRARIAAELTWPLDRVPIVGLVNRHTPLRNWYFSVEGFHDFGTGPLRSRVPGPLGLDNQPFGSGFMVTLSFGAAPGSVRPSTHPGDDLTRPAETEFQRMVTQGPASRARAREASRQFVGELEAGVRSGGRNGEEIWDDFINLRGRH